MFGNKYRRKWLGTCSPAEISTHHDNCRISSQPVQLSPLIVTTFIYYGSSGQFNVLESPVFPSTGMGGPMMFIPSDKWVTWDQVPDGLEWEKRRLHPHNPVPHPKGVQLRTVPAPGSMPATNERKSSVKRMGGGILAFLAAVEHGILAGVGYLLGGVYFIVIVGLNIAIVLVFFWMIFGGGCNYVASGCGGQ